LGLAPHESVCPGRARTVIVTILHLMALDHEALTYRYAS